MPEVRVVGQKREVTLRAGEGWQIHAPMDPRGGVLVIKAESYGEPVETVVEHMSGAECGIVSERESRYGVDISVSFKPTVERGYASCEIAVTSGGRLNLIEAGVWLE